MELTFEQILNKYCELKNSYFLEKNKFYSQRYKEDIAKAKEEKRFFTVAADDPRIGMMSEEEKKVKLELINFITNLHINYQLVINALIYAGYDNKKITLESLKLDLNRVDKKYVLHLLIYKPSAVKHITNSLKNLDKNIELNNVFKQLNLNF